LLCWLFFEIVFPKIFSRTVFPKKNSKFFSNFFFQIFFLKFFFKIFSQKNFQNFLKIIFLYFKKNWKKIQKIYIFKKIKNSLDSIPSLLIKQQGLDYNFIPLFTKQLGSRFRSWFHSIPIFSRNRVLIWSQCWSQSDTENTNDLYFWLVFHTAHYGCKIGL